jgi:hypothetical protein
MKNQGDTQKQEEQQSRRKNQHADAKAGKAHPNKEST